MQLRKLSHLALAFALGLSALASSVADAATRYPVRARNTYFAGVLDATANQTFATTSYADLAGASTTLYPNKDPNTTEAPGGPYPTVYARIVFTGVMSKATAGTGQCAIYFNGAVVTKTVQLVTFLSGSANNNVSAEWLLPNTTSGPQTVKVQCKSSDTNVLTVANAHVLVYSEE